MLDDLKWQHAQNARILDECEMQRKQMTAQREGMNEKKAARTKPPKDANQLAKYILDVSTSEDEKIKPPEKNPHA